MQSSTQTLGSFLRSHRERLSPAKVGLAAAGRRRTPGLRREEVAQLCAVSTTWYTWLEQGRPVRASASVLTRIAEALQLSRAERLYLFEIARCVVPDSSESYELEIPAGLKDLVHHIPVPVYVLDRQWNAVAWNGRAATLFRPWLLGSEERNLLRFVFLNRNARTLIVDWRSRAKRLVAEFRSDAGRHLTEPPTLRLISGLQSGSSVFARYWSEQDVREREGGPRAFCSATGAISTYSQVSLIPSINTDLKLVTLIPQPALQMRNSKEICRSQKRKPTETGQAGFDKTMTKA
jgi:transcriptional regulator with XRE-family HTH domain